MSEFDASAYNTIPADTRSTIIDGPSSLPSGGGRPALSEPKQESVGDSLRATLQELKGADAKDAKGENDAKDADDGEAKAAETDKKPAKLEKDDASAKGDAKDAKAAKESDADRDDDTDADGETDAEAKKREAEKPDASERDGRRGRTSEVRRHQPPARFLTEAKDVWRNTPHAVQREVARMEQEHAAEIERYRTATSEYEPLRPFADRARQSGTDLPTALSRYVAMEDAFRSDPSHGFRGLLQNLNMTPQQAVVALTRAFGVSPSDLARHIQQAPDQYNALAQPVQQPRAAAPQQAQQPPADPRVSQLEAKLAEMEERSVVMSVVEPFRSQHPRFDELQEDIAFFLKSGRIPQNLSPSDRLKEAYILAERLNPSFDDASTRDAVDESLAPRRAEPSSAGTKSIRSSLGGPNDGVDTEKDNKSLRDMLEDELRRARRRT